MYQGYAPPRQGRPRWALATSALLLLLTVALAQGLIAHKNRAIKVPMGEMRTYPEGRLRCALPLGWQTKSGEDLPGGAILGAVEAPSKEGPGRQLLVLRGLPQRYGLPSKDARATAARAMELLMAGIRKAEDFEACRIGKLAGWSVGSVAVSPLNNGRAVYILARAAMAPAGQNVVLVLILPNPIRSADRQLLDQVGDTLELLDVSFSDDASGLMKAAGVTFEPPAGAQFIESGSLSSGVCMQGGDGPSCWYLDVYRTWLLDKRLPADLVSDLALELTRQPTLPNPPEIEQIDGRQTARMHIVRDGESEASILLWAARVDARQAVLLVARHESEAANTVKGICRSIAGRATLTGDTVDLEQARQSAHGYLKTLRTRGLSSWFSAQQDRELEYQLRAPGITIGSSKQSCKSHQEDGVLWWEVASQTTLDNDWIIRVNAIDRWLIREDGLAHEYLYRKLVGARKVLEHQERRAAGSEQLERTIAVPNAKVRKDNVPLDELYAPEPVLLQAAALIAQDPDAKPALFSHSGAFTGTRAFWLLTPVGEREVPGKKRGMTAKAVLLQQDYDPAPLLMYFSKQGTLLAISSADGSWQELSTGDGPAI